MCLHMNFLLAELTKCLHLFSRVCASPNRCHIILVWGLRGITISETSTCFTTLYMAGQCSVFFVQHVVLEACIILVPGLALSSSPSLPLLPALQDPMRLEVTHPDLGAQLPCDKHR